MTSLPSLIEATQNHPILFKEQPVITTEQLTKFYPASSKSLQKNHLNNADRFIVSIWEWEKNPRL